MSKNPYRKEFDDLAREKITDDIARYREAGHAAIRERGYFSLIGANARGELVVDDTRGKESDSELSAQLDAKARAMVLQAADRFWNSKDARQALDECVREVLTHAFADMVQRHEESFRKILSDHFETEVLARVQRIGAELVDKYVADLRRRFQ